MADQFERIILVLGLVLVLSPVAWRVARFVALDTLIEEPRDRFLRHLGTSTGHLAPWLIKLYQCPFCITVWTAAGATGLWCLLTWYWLGWMFIYVWLGSATGAIAIWRYIDPPPPCVPSEPCDQE